MAKIEKGGPVLGEADIAGLEERLGARLPADFRNFLREHNGGVPRPDSVDVAGFAGSPTDVQVFFGIDRPVESSRIEWNLETFAGRLDRGFLPIATDSGGNLFCLSLRAEDAGAVFYCDLEAVWGQPEDAKAVVYPVAPDFSSFIDGLKP